MYTRDAYLPFPFPFPCCASRPALPPSEHALLLPTPAPLGRYNLGLVSITPEMLYHHPSSTLVSTMHMAFSPC